jgi:hypothetical protein
MEKYGNFHVYFILVLLHSMKVLAWIFSSPVPAAGIDG